MYSVELLSHLDQLADHSSEWDRLWHASHSTFASDQAALVALQAQSFIADRGAAFRAMLVRDDNGRLVAAIPFQWSHPTWLGPTASSLGNPWQPASTLLCDGTADLNKLASAIVQGFQREGVQMVTLDWLPMNHPLLEPLSRASQGGKQNNYLKPRYDVAVIEVPEQPEIWESSLSKNHRQKLRRWRRELERRGPLEFRSFDHTCPDETCQAFERALLLEHAGWKGQGDTSILAKPAIANYWRQWMLALLDHEQFRLHTLTNADHLIAFDFGFAVKGTYTSCKIAYDETLCKLGVGHVRDDMLFRRFISEGVIRRVDTFGPVTEASRKWPHHLVTMGRIAFSTGGWRANSAVRLWEGMSQFKATVLSATVGVHQ